MNIPAPRKAIPQPRKPLTDQMISDTLAMFPPTVLPKGQYVKVVIDPNGGFKIVTAYLGYIVGPRLDKQKAATWPERSHRLSLDEAKKAFAEWETFCAVNNKSK